MEIIKWASANGYTLRLSDTEAEDAITELKKARRFGASNVGNLDIEIENFGDVVPKEA